MQPQVKTGISGAGDKDYDMKFSNYLTVTILSNPTFCRPASSLLYQDLDGGLISVWSGVCLCVFSRNNVTELVSLVLGLQVCRGRWP